MSLLNIVYRRDSKAHSSSYGLQYGPLSPNGKGSSPVILGDKEVLRQFSQHEVCSDVSFIPDKMEIREGNMGREGADSQRILLLSSDRLHYRVVESVQAEASLGVAPDKEDISMV